MSRKLLMFLLTVSLSRGLYANDLTLYDEEQARLNQANHQLALSSEKPTEIPMIVFTPVPREGLKPDQAGVVKENIELEWQGEPVLMKVESHTSEKEYRKAMKRFIREEGLELDKRSSDSEDEGVNRNDTSVTGQEWLKTTFLWSRESMEQVIFIGAFVIEYPEHRGKIMIGAAAGAGGTATVVLVGGVLLDKFSSGIPEAMIDLIEWGTNLLGAAVFARFNYMVSNSVASRRLAGGGSPVARTTSGYDVGSYVVFPVVIYSAKEMAEAGFGTLKVLSKGHYEASAMPLIPVAFFIVTTVVVFKDKLPYVKNYHCPACVRGQYLLSVLARAGLTVVGAGMLSGAAHETEDLTDWHSPTVWDANNKTVVNGYDFWGDDSVLALILSPLGFRATPSVATMVTWLGYAAAITGMNVFVEYMYWKKARMEARVRGSAGGEVEMNLIGSDASDL
ncbi:hypothetical protein [Endozoicomonas numazuensis]|uniref:Uncharacterized protein n=1 Tax=Endozoicomonas numazuensis TaxID=1137799 RepID=A0A081NFL4_9GAMM|nr:hypothetical protein [Endozoicomonas numazuensis]KEQ17237.1 hypothetical protein GZ78_15515 [Endozoicomonas numazuensis]